jgi:hypothetical protein
MTQNRIVDQSKNYGLLTGVSAAAFCVAVLVIGYGIAKPVGHTLPSTNEVSASAQAGPMPSAVARVDSTPAASGNESKAATASQRIGWTDAARECASDKGITDACIFN